VVVKYISSAQLPVYLASSLFIVKRANCAGFLLVPVFGQKTCCTNGTCDGSVKL
jgi:hypothetical protein